jgi:photosystem II stability/assembly factor-like uncharacterized protein
MRRLAATIAIWALAAGCVAPLPPPSAEPPGLPTTQPSVRAATTAPVAPTPMPTGTEPAHGPAGPSLAALAMLDARHALAGGGLPNGADSGTNPTEGTIWRTDDAGTTWAPTGYAGSPVLALAARGDVVWAATGCLDGDCAARILVSRDRGASWSAGADRLVTGLSPIDADHGWAAAGQFTPAGGALLHTSDGGATWARVGVPCPFGGVSVVSFVTDRHGWVGCSETLGAGQEFKAVLETSDAGRTWAVRSAAGPDRSVGAITSSDYLAGLAMRPSGIGLIWMGRGTTIRSADGGRHWESIPPGEFDAVIPAAGAVLDDRTWFLLLWNGDRGESGIVASVDSGDHWVDWPPIPH